MNKSQNIIRNSEKWEDCRIIGTVIYKGRKDEENVKSSNQTASISGTFPHGEQISSSKYLLHILSSKYFVLHLFYSIYLPLFQSRLHSDKTCKTIRVVMGNKTCDLDSTVCALAQGLLEYVETRQCEPTVAVIPVMNITKKEFRLKTEVVLWLEIHKIPQSLLTFR